MTPSDLSGACASDATDAADEIQCDPARLMALLQKISAGAPAGGFLWPEGCFLSRGHVGLTEADRILAGLRVVQEVVLAAERSRGHDDADEYVGDRFMTSLMQACIALSAHAASRIHPQ